MTTYERVRVVPDDGTKPFTVILRDVTTSERFMTGIEVDHEGDEVAGRGADERRHLISIDLVTKRTPLVMDRLTARLVEPGDTMEENAR